MSDDPSSSQEEEGRRSADGLDSDDPDSDDEPEPKEEDDGRKPISVRDLMPPATSEGRRRAPERREPPTPPERVERMDRDEEPSGESEVSGEEADDAAAASPPTPVRVAMDAPPPGDSRPPQALPTRSFQARGEEWIVRITGRTVTGTHPDAGALLMHLTFFRSSDPEKPARELLTVDRPLEALYEEDLEEFLDRSRPAREPFEAASE